MKSMKLAALAVAMTLMFSGLALARDHDDYKNDHWDKHGDHDRHHDRDHDKWRENDRDRSHDNWRRAEAERERVERDHHWWERERRNDGSYGGGRFTTAADMVIPAEVRVIRVEAMDIPAVDTATLAPSTDVPAAAETRVTTLESRTADIWPNATGRRTSRLIRIRATSSATGRTATTVRSATRTTTGHSIPAATPKGISRVIAAVEAGDTRSSS